MSTLNSAVGAIAVGIQSYVSGANLTALTYVAPTAWTPNLQINGSSTGITYTTQIGTYSRIGNTVSMTCAIVLSSKGASVGAVTISNLPVSTGAAGVNNIIGSSYMSSMTLNSDHDQLCATFGVSNTVLSLIQIGSGQPVANLTDENLINTSALGFSCTYFIN